MRFTVKSKMIGQVSFIDPSFILRELRGPAGPAFGLRRHTIEMVIM